MENNTKTIEELRDQGLDIAQKVLKIASLGQIMESVAIGRELIEWGYAMLEYGHQIALESMKIEKYNG